MALEARHLIRLAPLLLLGAAGLLWLRHRLDGPEPGAEPPPAPSEYAGSGACRECHEEIYRSWAGSHHALAERRLGAPETPAFRPERRVRSGAVQFILRERAGTCEMVTGRSGEPGTAFRPLRAIGVFPLWQLIVPGPQGRYQVSQVAFDPARNEWFDVFGDDGRGPGDWGFWTGRGMSWNSMCASCHTTRLRKNYDPRTDSYRTAYLELGAGCEACHGPSRPHAEAGPAAASVPVPVPGPRGEELKPVLPLVGDPAARPRFDRLRRRARHREDPMLDACGYCHSRRVELTGRFDAGDPLFDHARPEIPDERELYYADGQVREEVYELVSFLSSRMYLAGVRCSHCHDPHSGKTRRQGNDLCLECHRGTLDPQAHSHHDLEQEGGQCVGCHMPVTTYMQRHPRRDHGFTVPDPLLTRELGVPNACNRCHDDCDPAWALEHTQSWYGEKMERWSRRRARAVARARRDEPGSVSELLQVLAEDPSPLWRAVAAALLGRWVASDERARSALLAGLADPDPLLRSACARSLEPLADAEAREGLARLLSDPVRLVRVDAAWSLRQHLSLALIATGEVLAFLDLNSDQPGGALQLGIFHMDRGDPETARQWIERAISWDPNSPPLHQALALALSRLGRTAEAVAPLEEAVRLAPAEGIYLYDLALARAETGEVAEACRLLEKVCALDPRFARAWYNLALARSQLDRPEEALEALDEALRLEPHHPEFLHARGTILLGLGDETGAREAFERAARGAARPDSPDAPR